ncbi:MAG: hypothetical protein AAGG50_02630 [Bacteroidota bacterium]
MIVMGREFEDKSRGGVGEVVTLDAVLTAMGREYRADPDRAVRSQRFIKLLHRYIGTQLEQRLTDEAKARGICIRYEGTIMGSGKPKDVDIIVSDPDNGPLVLIGVRSQMSSIGKNVLTYWEGIKGEGASLQDRFPMSLHAYLYLHPLQSIKATREKESIDHRRYARMYAHITGRSGQQWYHIRNRFDEFAYMIVDYNASPPILRDDIVEEAVSKEEADLSVTTFVDRIVQKYNKREIFWNVFGAGGDH